jgi:hypothetical protein
VGSGHEGLAEHNPNVASFHYEGEVYFNVVNEIVGRTEVLNARPQCGRGSSPSP